MSARVLPALAAFGCGFVFGIGLLISGMTQPSKVLGFLDILGAWDPSLAVVMAAALAVLGLGTLLLRSRSQPVLAAAFDRPTKTRIDLSLVAGAILFGVGWGLVGLCPGPALENLATLSPQVLVFCLAMAAGMAAHDYAVAFQPTGPKAVPTATSDG